MTPKYLLDTDALSESLRPRPHPGFLRRLREHRDQLALAATTWHEALFGMHRLPPGDRRSLVRDYLFDVVAPALPVLPYDAAAADWHARERARLAARGRTPPFADGQVAAVARTSGLVVVTRNVRHFVDFEGLVVEDWTAEGPARRSS